MSKAVDIIAGLQILITHDPGGWCSAEHDILYGPGEDVDFSEEDLRVLNAAGWYWDDDLGSWYIYT